jgi:hypothetical protein
MAKKISDPSGDLLIPTTSYPSSMALVKKVAPAKELEPKIAILLNLDII